MHSSIKRFALPLDVGAASDRAIDIDPASLKRFLEHRSRLKEEETRRGSPGLARVGAEWVAHLHQKMFRRNMCEDAKKHAHCSLSDYLH